MISCKDVSTLLLSDRLQSQKWSKRWEVRLHLAMCRHCSRLARQLRQLSTAARGMRLDLQADADFEERLLERLRK
jgi:hypothetical protein